MTLRGRSAVGWLAAATFMPAGRSAVRDAGLAFDSHRALPYADALASLMRLAHARKPLPSAN